MQKIRLICVLSSIILLTACGSDDQDKKDNYQPNSQVQIVNPSKMTAVQQTQEFPDAISKQQYAVADTTTAMPADTSTATDLPGLSDQVATPAPVSAQPAPQPSVPAPSSVPVPVAAMPSLPATSSIPVTLPSAATTDLNTKAAPTAKTPAANTMPKAPTATTTVTPVSTAQQQQVIEQYESLAPTPAPQAKPSYRSIENVATPVTFSNSPYNSALQTYAASPVGDSSAAVAPTTANGVDAAVPAVSAPAASSSMP